MSLPPFTRNYTCVKCGYARPHEHKPLLKWCPGKIASGTPLVNMPAQATVCRFGDAEHLHCLCAECAFEWATETVGRTEPLTSDEILFVREAEKAARETGE